LDGFLNPNGVAYVSPGLAARGAAYPGNVRPKYSNPNGVASMQELSRRVSQTLWVCLISGVFFVRVLLMGLCLGVSSRLDATPVGVDDHSGGHPGVGSIALRQPRAQIRNPVGVFFPRSGGAVGSLVAFSFQPLGSGLWAVGCGLWAVGCGLWAVGCGLCRVPSKK
jgi:hypothetical protein